MSENLNKTLKVTEEISFWVGVTIDVSFVIYFTLIFIFKDSLMSNTTLYLGIGLISHYLLKLIIFGVLLYPSWGIRVNIPGCKANTGDKICEIRDKKCTPGTCGEYEEVERYFNIDSYKKYLTVKNTSLDLVLNGSSRKYDLTRLITSEIISFMTCILYLLFLYFSRNNYWKTIIIRIVGLILLIFTITMIVLNSSDKDTNYIDSIQLISISIVLALMILFSLFNKISGIYKLSLLMIITFVVIPRIMIYLQKECIYKTQPSCLKSEDDDYKSNCKWHKTRRKCINLESSDNSIFGSSDSGSGNGGSGDSAEDTSSCSSYTNEDVCLDNDCYFVKLNVTQSDLSPEGRSKLISKTRCIPNNNICSEYSCTGDFSPLNIFDECCNNELYGNECTEDEIQSHLDEVKDSLDETKEEDSDIKELYGENAWSKKVDFDESYRFCESKNRRDEMDAGIYA